MAHRSESPLMTKVMAPARCSTGDLIELLALLNKAAPIKEDSDEDVRAFNQIVDVFDIFPEVPLQTAARILRQFDRRCGAGSVTKQNRKGDS